MSIILGKKKTNNKVDMVGLIMGHWLNRYDSWILFTLDNQLLNLGSFRIFVLFNIKSNIDL